MLKSTPELNGEKVHLHLLEYDSKNDANYIKDLGKITDFEKGDIVVFNKTGNRKWGHIAMWTGSQWVSDFKQKSIIVHSDYTGKAYHVFRWQ